MKKSEAITLLNEAHERIARIIEVASDTRETIVDEREWDDHAEELEDLDGKLETVLYEIGNAEDHLRLMMHELEV